MTDFALRLDLVNKRMAILSLLSKMNYRFLVTGIPTRAADSDHVSFSRIGEILSQYANAPLVPRLPEIRISAKRDRLPKFDLTRHTESVTSDWAASRMRVEGLKTKVFQLVELSSCTLKYPVTLKIPVSKGVEGKQGTTLFPIDQLKIVITLAVEHLRTLELFVIKLRVKEAAKQLMVTPNQINIEDRRRRIDRVLRDHKKDKGTWSFADNVIVNETDAKKIAQELVVEWEKNEIDAICRSLTIATWWTYYLRRNEQIKEDATIDQLVAEFQTKLRPCN